MKESARRVTLAFPYVDRSGKPHKADATISLPASEAADLIFGGRARVADPTKKTKE